jgi:hypothetical protein
MRVTVEVFARRDIYIKSPGKMPGGSTTAASRTPDTPDTSRICL